MVVAVLLHMARVFYTAAYRAPREFNWLIGMALLATTLGLSFTGYLLPVGPARLLGDHHRRQHRAVAARGHRRARHHGRTSIPGGLQKLLLLGSDTVGEEALIRFYLLHVMLLPLVARGARWPSTSGGSARTAAWRGRPTPTRALGAAGVDTLPGLHRGAARRPTSSRRIVRGRTPAVGRGPGEHACPRCRTSSTPSWRCSC